MKKRYLIIGGCATALILVWAIFFAVPQWRIMSVLEQDINNKKAQLSDFNLVLSQFQKTFIEYERLLEKKKSIISMLYTKEDLVKLFERFESLAQKSGVGIMEISPSVEELIRVNKTVPTNGQPLELAIFIRFEGHFKEVGQFIRAMEDEDYYKGLSRCHIINQGQEDTRSYVTYAFQAMLGTIKES